MSLEYMVKAFKIKVGNASTKLVLLKLADNANDKGVCWPSYQHIADQCEMSKRTVIRHVQKLEQSGLLKINHRSNEKGDSSNIYALTLDKSRGDNLSLGGDRMSPGGCHSVTGGVTEDHPEPVNDPVNDPVIKKNIKKGQQVFDFSSWPSKPSDDVLADWLEHRKTRKAKVTQTVINRIGAELQKAVSDGYSVDDCLAECCLRNWTGFKAQWMKPNVTKQQQPFAKPERQDPWLAAKGYYDQPQQQQPIDITPVEILPHE